MQEQINSMLGWLYREIDLTAITAPTWRSPIRPSESYDWVLDRIQALYFSDDSDPSVFPTATWRLNLPQQNSNLQEITVPIPLTLNPGIYDQTAGTTRPKAFYFKSIKIDWPIMALQSFTIEIENYAGIGILQLLFLGHFILPKPIMVNNE